MWGNLDNLGGFNGYSFNSEDIQNNKKKNNFVLIVGIEKEFEREGYFDIDIPTKEDTGHFDTGHLLSGFTPHSTLSFLQSSTTNPVYFTSQVPSVKFAQLSREINNLSKKDKAFGEISN